MRVAWGDEHTVPCPRRDAEAKSHAAGETHASDVHELWWDQYKVADGPGRVAMVRRNLQR